MKTHVVLFIDGGYPTLHKTVQEAFDFFKSFPRSKAALYTTCTEKDFSEGFANCLFKRFTK